MKNCSLFVSNLPFQFDINEFRNMFAQYGALERIDIPDQHGRPKTIAYVHFVDEFGAKNALENLNQKPFGDRDLIIKYSDKPKKQYQPMQRNMSGSSTDFSRPRPPFEHGKRLPFPISDCDQYVSLPCKLMAVNLSDSDANKTSATMGMSVPVLDGQNNQTYTLTTSIISGDKQPMTASIFLMPLSKENPYNQYPQPGYPPTGYPPAYPPQYPPSYPPPGGQSSQAPQYPYPPYPVYPQMDPTTTGIGSVGDPTTNNKTDNDNDDNIPSWMRSK